MGCEKVFGELVELRDQLRHQNAAASGKEPKICSNESLYDMAMRLPSKTSDLLMIKGIGETFAQKYGEKFLMITRKYIRDTAKCVHLTGKSAETLKELEKKLINISKGNCLLYNPRIVVSRTYDLTDTDLQGPLKIVFSPKHEYVLCNSSFSTADASRYKRLNQIQRETIREYREKGFIDLYIAYPFVIGCLPGEDFPIRAPLALFPVKLDKDSLSVTVKYDDTRDALYNNTLILANMKFGGLRKKLPDCVIEDTDQKRFNDSMLKFYSDNGMKISGSVSGDLMPFEKHTVDDFKNYPSGELRIENCAVIGKFPLFSNAIQKDFDELTAKSEINGVLDDLISSPMNLSVDERTDPLTAEDMTKRGLVVSEHDMTYVNAVNSAQEQVIAAMEKMDELVVQGPPGTGKSQVITSLITTAVNEGKTVIMVSEKKTALDVVYSRLGHLSKYTMMIDDVTNKDLFYDQLNSMMNLGPLQPGGPVSIDELSDSIDSRINDLTRIADGMYSPGEFGIEPYKMYSLVKKVDLNDPREYERYTLLKNNISPSLMQVGYHDISETYGKFRDNRTVVNLRSYYQCLDAAPWMALMKPSLTDYDVRSMKHDLVDLEKEAKEWRSKNFISKLFGKGHVTRLATAILDKYFTTYNAKNIDQMINEPLGTAEALGMYDDFSMKATAYSKLSKMERLYGENIISVNTKIPSSFEMSNDELFTFVVMDHLRRFEADNKELLQDIKDFDTIRKEVDDLVSKKRDASAERVGYILRDDLRSITDSKMNGEIVRVIDSKRRWSVKKFINRFGSDLFRGIKVWLMTPDAVSELLPMEAGLFDLLVFDEASQMYVEKGIPSIYRAKKVVVAGDHKQLRPSSLGSGRMVFGDDDDDEYIPAALDEDSLLDLARSRYDSILLNFHYRSKYEELIAFSNYAFYGGRLYVSPNVDVPSVPPIETHLVGGAKWENKSNMKEAVEVIGLLRSIFRDRKEDETIGIITFNVSQRDLIYDLLDDECRKDDDFRKQVEKEMSREDKGEDVGLFLKNIESVQGDERDIIIFSIGYAKNEDGRILQRFGWLNNVGGENRLNVAVSRARKKIHIVTSFMPSELKVDDTKNDGPKLLKRYLEYAFAVSSGDREEQKAILGSFSPVKRTVEADSGSVFDDQIYNALKLRGCDVEKNVGIGGYSIDVAVRKGDRYVLGIECDSALYSGAESTRERDYHRQKYLESRGWKIRRVWSNSWWNDPESEIEAIMNEVRTS